MSAPTGIYVDRFYEMDPEFDDLIFGTELRDGMVVLIEDSLLRGDPERAFRGDTPLGEKYEIARCREANRWCTVTRLSLAPRAGYEPLVRFIGEYADGTKAIRQYSSDYAWLVKRASLDVSP
jgi:hypothetical protein